MRADGITRAAALAHQRLLLLQRVPPVPRGPRRRRRRGARTRPSSTGCAHYFNHPGFIEPMVDATLAALAELPEEARTGGHLAFVTHSIPIDDERPQRPARWRLRRPAPGRGRRDRRAGPRGDRAPLPLRRWSSARGPGRPRSRGWSPTSTTTSARCRSEACPAWSWCRSGSSPTTWRSSTTSTPRPGRPPRRSGCPFARAATAGRRPAVRGDGARPAPRARAPSSGASHRSGPRPGSEAAWDVCAGRLLPQPARSAAGPVRPGLTSRSSRLRGRSTCSPWRSSTAREAGRAGRRPCASAASTSPAPSPARSTW